MALTSPWSPESFTGVDPYIRPALFVPMMMKQSLEASRDDPLENRGAHDFTVKARLKPGASQETARAELAAIWNSLQQAYPDANRGRKADVKTEIQARYQQDPYDAILVMFLMGLVALVLIIACANVANLLLARANARSCEIAIRLAVGATRVRLIRQFLLESLVLALLGGVFGVGLSYAGIRFLQRIQVPSDLPIVIGIQLDHRVVEFSLLAALASALFFGLAPALQSSKTGLVPALKAGAQGLNGRRRTIGRNILVVGQVALSMALLVAAGMLVDAVGMTLSFNPGFRTDHLLMMEFDTALVRYTDDQTRDFYRSLRDRASALPGVRSVTMTCFVPFSPNGYGKSVVPEAYQLPKGQDSVSTPGAVVDEHYFDTMKMPIIRGRGFVDADKAGTGRVAVVNEEFGKTYWPKRDPIGKRFRLNDSKGPWVEVVGLTRTSRYYFIAEPPMKFLYLPFAQEQTSRMSLIVETFGDPAAVAAPLRSMVRGIDPNQPIYNVRTLSSFYEQRAISVAMTLMQTVATMGLLGLTLALIGLYGLIAYSVSRRTKEIGIRMAIGANKTEVLRMVLRQGFVLAAVGILVGGALSVGVARMLAIGLAGLGTPNPITYVVVPIALLLITLVACYIPARRASLIDPIRALRYE
jgi:predicted permease